MFKVQCRSKSTCCIWRDARTVEKRREVPIVYSKEKMARKIARDLELLWEPHLFRVVNMENGERSPVLRAPRMSVAD